MTALLQRMATKTMVVWQAERVAGIVRELEAVLWQNVQPECCVGMPHDTVLFVHSCLYAPRQLAAMCRW